jgi:membrane-bound serine protease (ClpP class)
LTELLTKISGQGVHTIAVVDDQAMGMSTLVALACDKIVVKAGTDARLGDVTKIVPAGGAVEPVGPGFVKPLAETAEALARDHMHPEALARAMVDPSIEVVEARDNQSGASVFVTSAQVDANPKKFTIQRVIKPPGKALELDAVSAVELRVADEQTDSLKSWLKSQGLENIPVDQPSWVDQLVLTLNNPAVSGLLLFIGLFMLILELKLPGVGLPAIISALAFLLFFWSHYLGGTADRLEILLFLAGLVAMALELFVFPGFGVFGFTGVLLVLGSVIMASHTFVWPTQDYEYRQLGWTLAQISITIVSVAGSAILLGRFFPSMPLFRRMVLVPQDPSAGDEKPAASFESGESLAYLLGERGRTTTVCRPIGKARFGDILIDVIADGFYYEADTPVEVIEVRGTQVLVKRI